MRGKIMDLADDLKGWDFTPQEFAEKAKEDAFDLDGHMDIVTPRENIRYLVVTSTLSSGSSEEKRKRKVVFTKVDRTGTKKAKKEPEAKKAKVGVKEEKKAQDEQEEKKAQYEQDAAIVVEDDDDRS